MKKNKIMITFTNMKYALYLSFKVSPFLFFLKCIILIINSFFPFIISYLWKEIINALTNSNEITKWLLFIIIAYFLTQIFVHLKKSFDNYVNYAYYEAVDMYKDGIKIDKMCNMNISFFDSSTLRDKLSIANEGYESLTEITWCLFDIISDFVSVVISFIIISKYNIYISFFTILFVLPLAIFNKKFQQKEFELKKGQAKIKRERDYCSRILEDNRATFEIKLNKIGEYFLSRYKRYCKIIFGENLKFRTKHGFLSALLSLFSMVSYFVVISMSVYDTVIGIIGIGDIQYNVSIVSNLRNNCTKLLNDINVFGMYNEQINNLNEFNNLEVTKENSGELIPCSCPKIEFKNVWFKYPAAETYVLRNCSFVIHPKEKVGLVGLNGTGKSTIIKLLFRFYDPQKGKILLNGVDIKKYDIKKVRRLFGILFQEQVNYSLTLRETIGLSDYKNINDEKKLDYACSVSNFEKIISSWNNKYDVYLGRLIDPKGKDLSGGQWQVLGLARTYFYNTDFIVLDEPSASLDPITEEKIFNNMIELSSNKSAVIISHRLSNMLCTDRILVLENGEIVEEGSHQQLINKNGKYAKMFKMQSEKYS